MLVVIWKPIRGRDINGQQTCRGGYRPGIELELPAVVVVVLFLFFVTQKSVPLGTTTTPLRHQVVHQRMRTTTNDNISPSSSSDVTGLEKRAGTEMYTSRRHDCGQGKASWIYSPVWENERQWNSRNDSIELNDRRLNNCYNYFWSSYLAWCCLNSFLTELMRVLLGE